MSSSHPHKFRVRRTNPVLGRRCSACGAYEGSADEFCAIARSDDPALDSLYKSRRHAAERSNESGYKGMAGWAELEQIERSLHKLDPEGDWRYEGDDYDGKGWRVRRP